MIHQPFFGNRQRCTSYYTIWKDAHEAERLQCGETAGHGGAHVGRLQSGLFHMWTDAEALAALAARPKIQRHKRIGAIEAWRAWRVLSSCLDGRPKEPTYYLMSTGVSKTWDGPVMTTMGDKEVWSENTHAAGQHHDKDPGVHCYKHPKLLMEYFGYASAVGRIHLTGHVVEHQLGYRAQRATIQELWLIGGRVSNYYGQAPLHVNEDMRAQMEERYHCDVHILPLKQLDSWTRYYTDEYFARVEKEEQDERDRKASS